jgi:hypothetical protein
MLIRSCNGTSRQRESGCSSGSSADHARPENLRPAAHNRADCRNMMAADVERLAEWLPCGTPQQAMERLIGRRKHTVPAQSSGFQPRRNAAGDVAGSDPPVRS